MSNRDFEITEGVLKKYHGSAGVVVVPQGVTEIGEDAFIDCTSLTEIVIPQGVTVIGYSAFHGCTKLASVTMPQGITAIKDHAFYDCTSLTAIVLPEGLTGIGDYAFGRCTSLAQVTLPKGLQSIGIYAFSKCTSLTRIEIPEGVSEINYLIFYECASLAAIALPESATVIDDGAFEGCTALRKLKVPESVKLTPKQFGDIFPPALTGDFDRLQDKMSDGLIKDLLTKTSLWADLSTEEQVRLWIDRHGKTLLPVYLKIEEEPDKLGEGILAQLSRKANAKTCRSAALFMELFAGAVSENLLKELYGTLKKIKAADAALKKIRANNILMAKLEENRPSSLNPAEQWVIEHGGISASNLEAIFHQLYGNVELPELLDAEGKQLHKMVLQWLLTVHEKEAENAEVEEVSQAPGVDPKAQELLMMIDKDSFQRALAVLATNNLGITGHTRKMYLAYPICRYADEVLMQALTEKAPSWKSYSSGNDAPPLRTFRAAAQYSNTKAAMMFADQYQELEQYARLHAMDADTIRDQLLSDVDLDEKGQKSYDLGGRTVTAQLQTDLTYLFVTENGKKLKSLPKRGADPEKYEQAAQDFAQLKKDTKIILKNRTSLLLQRFLDGQAQSAESWKQAYLKKPLLRSMAKLLVWQQGTETFILGEAGPVRADGTAYVLSEADIFVAHPMEMKRAEIIAWQKYVIAHHLKQPFLQIWEPVMDGKTISSDRFRDCEIPFYRFMNQEKHGIHILNSGNLYEDIEAEIEMKDCDTEIHRSPANTSEEMQNILYRVERFAFSQYTRQVNHIAAYLDKIAVTARILKDDVSIEQQLPAFTLAQIMEFIDLAAEHHCSRVTALLLNYKRNFN